MCLYIKLNDKDIIYNGVGIKKLHLNHPTVSKYKRISKSTITCYKIVRKNTLDNKTASYYSMYLNFNYEIGFHYFNVGRNKFVIKCTSSGKNILIYEGLHAYTSLAKVKKKMRAYNKNYVILKCIIPKGSEYFIDTVKNEIVSDNLIIKSKM